MLFNFNFKKIFLSIFGGLLFALAIYHFYIIGKLKNKVHNLKQENVIQKIRNENLKVKLKQEKDKEKAQIFENNITVKKIKLKSKLQEIHEKAQKTIKIEKIQKNDKNKTVKNIKITPVKSKEIKELDEGEYIIHIN
jgi:hypothetical protein